MKRYGGKIKEFKKSYYGPYVHFTAELAENEFSLLSFRKKLDELELELLELGCKAISVEITSKQLSKFSEDCVGVLEIHGERVENEEEKTARLARMEKREELDKAKIHFDRLKAQLANEEDES